MNKHTGISRIGVLVLAIVALDLAVLGWFVVRFVRQPRAVPAQYKYDLSAYRTDPRLVLFAPAGQFDTGLAQPRCLAIDRAALVYVSGDHCVRVFENAKPLREIAVSSGEPAAVAIADDGRLYVGVGDHVEVFDAQGARQANWPAPARHDTPKTVGLAGSGLLGPGSASGRSSGSTATHPAVGAQITAIAVSGDDVFVADAVGRVVRHYNTQGKLVGTIDGKGNPEVTEEADGGFIVPSPYFDLAVAPDGLLRVVNPGRHRVEAYTFDGQRELVWGRPGIEPDAFSGCCNPVYIALLPDGRFVTSEKGLLRIKLYDAAGKFLGIVAGPETFLKDHPQAFEVCPTPGPGCMTGGLDVAVDSAGRVLVLDPAAKAVRIFSPLTAQTSTAPSTGPAYR